MNTIIFHEYIYKKLCELEEQQETILYAMRTKKGLLILSDKLWEIEVQKAYLTSLYNELKQFFQ